MSKIRVSNICGVGIIYKQSNPEHIFLEVKDDGYPQKVMQRKMCLIGGNWIGEAARSDVSPEHTFGRELQEELSFERPIRTSLELVQLGVADMQTFPAIPAPEKTPDSVERVRLEYVKSKILYCATHFANFILTVPKSVLDSADPENKREGYTALASYFTCGLDDKTWDMLCELHEKFGNLSNESITLVTSLGEIIETGRMCAFGHDRPLQAFFLQQGLPDALSLPLLPGVSAVWVGEAHPTHYEEYLKRYDVVKKP